MANPVIFLFGYRTLSADIKYAAKIFNVCRENGITYRNQKSDGESITIDCSLVAAARLLKICEAQDIPFTSNTPHGLPHLLEAYRHRYGIFAGALIAVLLIFLSGRVLWDIRIDGAIRLTEKQVREELSLCGLKVGMPLRDIDADVIQNRMIIYSDDVSWISVNLSGTVAHVEIRESEPLPSPHEEYEAANLVATDDGEISGFEEVRGEIKVRIGDLVSQGELLVSGIHDSATQGFTFSCAEGKVYAKTRLDYSVEVPLKYEKKVYSDKVYEEKYLVFFNKEIKIYSNNRNLDISCDIIDTVEYVNVFSLGELPFGIRTVKHHAYEYQTAERSGEEAIDLAFYKLRCVEEELGVNDVISKELVGTLEDGIYRLSASTTLVKNIAKQVEVNIISN